MPEVIKVKAAVSRDAQTLTVTDITGDVLLNGTGWGTPNHELDQSCLAFLVQRKGTQETDVLSSDNTNLVYDAVAANTKQTAVQFNFVQDGAHYVTLFRLPVSTNGSTVLEGGGITNGTYFYWNGSVWKMVSSVPEEVDDLSVMIGDITVIQGTCKDLLYPKLAMKKQAIYKQYRLQRDKACDDALDYKEQARSLQDELTSASYTFWSGLEVDAQDQIESLIDLYQITANT